MTAHRMPVKTPDQIDAEQSSRLVPVDRNPLRRQARDMEELLEGQPRMYSAEEQESIRERIQQLRDQADAEEAK